MSKGGNMLQQQKKKTRKMDYFAKLSALLAEYPSALIVAADNVGSLHLQQVRRELRGKAVLLMGKNTLIRKCIRDNRGKNRALDALLPHVKGNVGFIFARDWVDLADLRASVEAVQAQAPARVGAVAPCAVVVPGGPTFLDPAKTNFFASLNIPTRIYRGTIEIMFDVPVLAAGEKVTATHAALFKRLDMKPFRYQLVVRSAYVDGEVHPASMLDVTSDHVVAHLTQGVADVAALSLRLGYPTAVSVPHALAHSFHQLLAVSLATDYTFRQAAPIKQLLADPAALALARAAAAGYSVAPAVGGREDDDDDGDDDDEGEILIDFEDW